MEIRKLGYEISKKVRYYAEIRREVEDMIYLVDNGVFGLRSPYALSHCQVSDIPYAFFVVNKGLEKAFLGRVVINPRILTGNVYTQSEETGLTITNIYDVKEACMSFPHKEAKYVERFDVIDVEYFLKRWWGFKKVRRKFSGLISQIFQHEVDHCNGKNIYYKQNGD